jgi:hypothetical protein
MTILKHVHRLKKHKYPSGTSVFFCTLPDCTFKVEVPFSIGKTTACNICGEAFLMNDYSIKLNKPHCPNCGRREVKDPNGKKHYIRQVNKIQVLASIANDETVSLKDRLAKATIIQMTSGDNELVEPDDDI